MRHEMETPGDRLVKSVKEWLKDFSKTKYAIPTIIALTCLVYYFVVTAITSVCFSNLIAPLFMLALLWKSGVKSIKRLLLIGAVATLFFAVILTAVVVDQLQHVDPVVAENADGSITGTLDPWFVDKGVPFTFRLNVTIGNLTWTPNSAHVELVSTDTFASGSQNLTMTPEPPYNYTDAENRTFYVYNFTLTTTTPRPINQFIFKVDLNGTWITAGDRDDYDNVYYITGPIYKDSYAVAGPVVFSAIQLDFVYVFGPYAIMLGMIWWTRRARRMREKQVEKWQAEQAKEDAAKPKSTSKVPSLDAAMGKVEEGFVCSECGADVPSDATVCPRCGEKFD